MTDPSPPARAPVAPPAPTPAVPETPRAPAATPPTPKPSTPPAAAKPAAVPSPPVRIPRTGQLQDRGVSRRDSVHALAWTVDGTVKVTGEVDVGNGRVTGGLSVGGPISADEFACRGTLDAGATVMVAHRLETDGSFHAIGPVQAHEVTFAGTTRITREVTVETSVTVRGQFAASAVRAGDFHGDGSVDVPGAIDAGQVDVRIRRTSRFGTIRARSVRLIQASPNPLERIFGGAEPTPVSRIEADRVELEGVDVAFIHSPEVILGRGAHVTEIEGTVVRRHSTARVGPRSKSQAPYGLSR